MKRIQYACLNQTLHFKLKDDISKDWAQRLVQDEYAAYKRQLDDRRVPYRILREEVQPDGSIVVMVKRQLTQYDVGPYLDD